MTALSEELENPMNVHRWRKLEGEESCHLVCPSLHSLSIRYIAMHEVQHTETSPSLLPSHLPCFYYLPSIPFISSLPSLVLNDSFHFTTILPYPHLPLLLPPLLSTPRSHHPDAVPRRLRTSVSRSRRKSRPLLPLPDWADSRSTPPPRLPRRSPRRPGPCRR